MLPAPVGSMPTGGRRFMGQAFKTSKSFTSLERATFVLMHFPVVQLAQHQRKDWEKPNFRWSCPHLQQLKDPSLVSLILYLEDGRARLPDCDEEA